MYDTPRGLGIEAWACNDTPLDNPYWRSDEMLEWLEGYRDAAAHLVYRDEPTRYDA